MRELIEKLRDVRKTGPLSDQDYDRLDAADLLERQAALLAEAGKALKACVTVFEKLGVEPLYCTTKARSILSSLKDQTHD
jgi:hypothetical protein